MRDRERGEVGDRVEKNELYVLRRQSPADLGGCDEAKSHQEKTSTTAGAPPPTAERKRNNVAGLLSVTAGTDE